jgi:hypothetical protein
MPPARRTTGLRFDELQRWFLERVVAPHRTTGEPGPAPERAIEDVILPSSSLDAEARLAIYSTAYFLRLREIMAMEHPVVERLMGKAAFSDLVRDYLSRYPPRGHSVHTLPHALPHYLKYHCTRDDAGLLRDVARLERAISDAFDVHSLGTLDSEDLARIPAEAWPLARFRLDPSVRVMAFEHDACRIVNAHHENEPLPDLSPRASWAVVWRHESRIWRRPLSRARYEILAALAAGENMTTALERASQVWDGDESELETRIFEWFADWLRESYFRAVELADPH